MAIDAIHHFRLEQSTDGQNWTVLQDPIAPDVRSFVHTDEPAPTIWYRLFGFTNNGITFPYNIVSITGDPQGAFQWVRTPSSSGIDVGRALAADGSGNIFYTGYQAGSMKLIKYSPTGSELYNHSVGSTDGWAVASDSAGNTYWTGFYQGTTNFGLGWLPNGTGVYETLFVCKFNKDGVCQWAKGYPAGAKSWGRSIKLNSSGEVVVCGFFQGSIDFGGGEVTGAALQTIFLLKINANDGSYINAKTFGPSGGDANVAASISIGPSDVIWMTGWFLGNLNIGISNTMSNGFDIFVAKFDTNLNTLFFQRYGDARPDYGQAIAATSDGGCVFGGKYRDNLDLGGAVLSSTGSYHDGFICKLNSAGAYVWSRRISGNADAIDEVQGIVVDSQGNVLVCGNISGSCDFGSGQLTPAGFNDAFVAKYNSLGEPIWAKTFGDYSIDKAFAVCTDASRNVIAAGQWYGTINFGGGNITGPGGGDAFIIKYSP